MLLVLTRNTLSVYSDGMDRQPAFDLHPVCAALARAIALKQTQQKLAAACGVSQAAISQAKIFGRLSPRLAIAIHRATAGAVPGSALRPDLWRRPEDVPVEASVQPQRSAADAGGAPIHRRNHLLDGVRQGTDGREQGHHGTLFRLSERPHGIFVEIVPCDASRQELDSGEAGAKHLAQVQRDDERTRVAHDRGHDFPLAVRMRTPAGDYLSENYYVDGNDIIVSLRILVVVAPDAVHPGGDRAS